MPPKGLAKFQSVISTRRQNKDRHPGEVDAPQKRRSQQEMKTAREEKARALQEKEQEDSQNIEAAAQVEDLLRKQDIDRRSSNRRANGQPPYRPDRELATDAANVGPSDSDDNDIYKGKLFSFVSKEPTSTDPHNMEESEASGAEDEYFPDKHSSDGEDGESEVDVAVEEEDDNRESLKKTGRKGKQPKLGRADVKAVRQVTSATFPTRLDAGKRKAQESNEPQQANKKSKNTLNQPSGFLKGWDSSRKWVPSSSNAPNSTLTTEDDSMVRPGGIIDDIETDDVERKALDSKGGKKRILPNPIKITASVPSTQPTKKALRGGARKWKLTHLPAGTQELFTNTLVSFAKIKAGTLDAWATLSASQIQELVDVVYPGEGHIVSDDDVWCGLIAYRLSNWRNTFLTHANEAVRQYINTRQYMFPNREKDIAEFVGLFLEVQGTPPTAPFHWREWIEDDATGKVIKRGRFQNELIMYTLAHAHFSEYDEIPDPCSLRKDELPVGALILSMQAVEHTFKSWLTGTFVEDKTPQGYFSADKYADKYIRKEKNGRKVDVLVKRAGLHLPTIKDLRQEQWVAIFNTIVTTLEGSKRKKNRSKSVSSRASSEVFDIEEEHPDYIVVSDDE